MFFYAALVISNAQEFCDELSEVTDWIKFGCVLGIPYSMLMHVQLDAGGCNMSEKYGYLIFEEWRKLEIPTWTKAIISLHVCEMEEIGRNLEKSHSKYIILYGK